MAKSLIEAVNASKCKKLDRQIRGSEFIQKQAIKLAETVKIGRSQDPEVLTAFQLGCLYYDMLATYYCKYNFIKPTMDKKSLAFWKRVEAARERAGVSSSDFIKAQFDWFDKHLKTAPPLPSLTTDNAVDRAVSFVGGSRDRVVGQSEYKSEEASVIRYIDVQVRQICKAQNLTKEEFYTKLVIPGNFPIPEPYLKVCPIWKKVTRG